jgi:amidase
MADDDLAMLELAELAARLRVRELSPVEVTETMLARIDALEPGLHAFVRVTADRARADARRAEAEISAGQYRGPLHGVPIALKDLVDTAGIATEAGTRVMAGRVPTEDATVASRLAGAGAVLLGKLALTEGAFSEHRPERPEPRNPWSRDHWTGVSSSGSGVAVAAGLAFGALGSDTGGSIRFPCTACGVTGLKPSWGRVSVKGVFPLAASLDHVGPMARSAADCALLFDAIAGPDPADPVSLPDPWIPELGDDITALRIGLDRAVLAGIHPDVARVVEQAAAALAGAGAEICDVTLPPLEPFAQGWAITCGVEAAIGHAGLYEAAPDDYGPALRSIIELGRNVPARAYAELHQARLAFGGAMARLHGSIDLIALPAIPTPTPTLALLAQNGNDPDGVAAMLRFTAPFDYSGQPTLSLPGGLDQDGLPIGFQLVGPVRGEAKLLRAGRAFQKATDWHRRRPPVSVQPATRPPLEVA